MPVHVKVSIKMRGVGYLEIYRTEKLDQREEEYDYRAVIYEGTDEIGSVHFLHDRDDSVWILIQKALFALAEKGDLPLEWEHPG